MRGTGCTDLTSTVAHRVAEKVIVMLCGMPTYNDNSIDRNEVFVLPWGERTAQKVVHPESRQRLVMSHSVAYYQAHLLKLAQPEFTTSLPPGVIWLVHLLWRLSRSCTTL